MRASEDSDRDDLSTFVAECKELAYALCHADQRALVLVSLQDIQLLQQNVCDSMSY
jgi:hypothetical protein